MRNPSFPIPSCRPRTAAVPQSPPDYGFAGIARYQADLRYQIEQGASTDKIAELRRELRGFLVRGLADGSLAARCVADEASTAIDHGGPLDTAMLVFYRNSLDLCGGSREEIDDADQLIRHEVERLKEKLARCPARRRVTGTADLSLLQACQAKAAQTADRKLDLARQSLNQAYAVNRDAWRAYLTALLIALLLRGEFEMAAALRRYLVTQGVRGVPQDPSLNPRLWRCAGRKTHGLSNRKDT